MRPGVFWIDGPWAGKLAIAARPRGGEWLEGDIADWKSAGVSMVVCALQPPEVAEMVLGLEREVVQAAGLEFLSVPLPDRGVPASIQKFHEAIVKIERCLGRGGCGLVHCRMGIGRSAVISACSLILGGVKARDALSRVQMARGCEVPDTADQASWIMSFEDYIKSGKVAPL